MGSYDCLRLYSYELLRASVIIHSYKCICTNTSECIRTNIIRTSVIAPLVLYTSLFDGLDISIARGFIYKEYMT